MARLNEDERAFLVRGFARNKGVTQIMQEFEESFGYPVAKGHVSHYNPRYATNLGHKWHELYRRERKKFCEDLDLDSMPLVHLAVRVQRLGEMSEDARLREDYDRAMALIRMISEEVGHLPVTRPESKREPKARSKRSRSKAPCSTPSRPSYYPHASQQALQDHVRQQEALRAQYISKLVEELCQKARLEQDAEASGSASHPEHCSKPKR